jgi:hypothetical protein
MFFLLISGSYCWRSSRDKANISRLKNGLGLHGLKAILFRPFYEAAGGNGDNVPFSLVIETKDIRDQGPITSILKGFDFIEAVDSVVQIAPDWVKFLTDGCKREMPGVVLQD